MIRMKRNGPIPKPPSERFWSKVDKRGPHECWKWVGANMNGYGFLSGPRVDGAARWVKAHRLSWEMANGPIPVGASILHHCDNPACVNPAHLYAGTQQQNVKDRADRKRGREQRQRGESNTNAKLSVSKVQAIRLLVGNGMSQTEVARMFGVSQPQVSRIVRKTSWDE